MSKCIESVTEDNPITDISKYISIVEKLNYSCNMNNKQIQYLNIAVAFDIETTSFFDNNEKSSLMYAFTINVQHIVYVGRTLEDFKNILMKLVEIFELNYRRRIIIYVHNLSFEFQFIRKVLDWGQIFALEERKLVYAITDDGIEFRCSYLLSGYSLSNLAKIRKLPVDKLIGDLDYDKIRHTNTFLTDKELQYIVNDGEIVVYYIEQLIKEEIYIHNIPLTKTAYVRRHTRNNCNNIQYKKMLKNLTIEPSVYTDLKEAFAGGFTHANMFNVGKVINNVDSYDLNSSYPSVLVCEQFPMSKGIIINNPTENEVNDIINNFCAILEVEYYNIESNSICDHIISHSKCKTKGNVTVDNGRIIEAEYLKIKITEQDFLNINDFYTYQSVKVVKIIKYYKSYLPTSFVKTVLELYAQKTQLKDIDGREMEYLNIKEMLNSLYGMIVTDILRDEILYSNDEWDTCEIDSDIGIDKYNNSPNRFLYYPWGVWVTAYARRNLIKTLKQLGSDYIYSDTDSLKFISKPEHINTIKKYNNDILIKMKKAMEYHNLPIEMTQAVTKKGKIKYLGFWEKECTYKSFKTLGAKRYMTHYEDNRFNITVAGLNKQSAVPYLLSRTNTEFTKNEYGEIIVSVNTDKVFKEFDDGLYIPKEFSGKNAFCYIDEKKSGIITDYLGNEFPYYSPSGIHFEKSDYSLSLSESFARLLLGISERII